MLGEYNLASTIYFHKAIFLILLCNKSVFKKTLLTFLIKLLLAIIKIVYRYILFYKYSLTKIYLNNKYNNDVKRPYLKFIFTYYALF